MKLKERLLETLKNNWQGSGLKSDYYVSPLPVPDSPQGYNGRRKA